MTPSIAISYIYMHRSANVRSQYLVSYPDHHVTAADGLKSYDVIFVFGRCCDMCVGSGSRLVHVGTKFSMY